VAPLAFEQTGIEVAAVGVRAVKHAWFPTVDVGSIHWPTGAELAVNGKDIKGVNTVAEAVPTVTAVVTAVKPTAAKHVAAATASARRGKNLELFMFATSSFRARVVRVLEREWC
jgi:hypothetical protein